MGKLFLKAEIRENAELGVIEAVFGEAPRRWFVGAVNKALCDEHPEVFEAWKEWVKQAVLRAVEGAAKRFGDHVVVGPVTEARPGELPGESEVN